VKLKNKIGYFAHEKPHSQKDKGKRHGPKLRTALKSKHGFNRESDLLPKQEQPHSLTVASCRLNEDIIMCIYCRPRRPPLMPPSYVMPTLDSTPESFSKHDHNNNHNNDNINTFNPSFVNLVNGSVPHLLKDS
jgi:hypothetical protein